MKSYNLDSFDELFSDNKLFEFSLRDTCPRLMHSIVNKLVIVVKTAF